VIPALLEVRDLSVEFSTPDGVVRPVERLSFDLVPGQTLGLVGESGSGKSLTGLALMGLVPAGGRIVSGRIRLDGQDLSACSERQWRALRGRVLSMVFQEPMTALNPVVSIGNQIVQVLRRHEKLSRRAARARAVEMLTRVRIPSPQRRFHAFPHQLSGGQRQRVMIAMALVTAPRLLIADEPTSALDPTTQVCILEEISQLTRAQGTSVVLISHDLAMVSAACDRIMVMYAGSIVEYGEAETVTTRPAHRYTEALLHAAPAINGPRLARLPELPGQLPDPLARPNGCRFAPRCGHATAQCWSETPGWRDCGASRAACLHPASGA